LVQCLILKLITSVNALTLIKMKVLPEEAINAVTFNAVVALEHSELASIICKGKTANFIITKLIPSYAYIF
jgi:imidazolonepropionase